jgi:NAD(P)-dependent dehydrogenase (short-subunit alcohol dehydrogenase family)
MTERLSGRTALVTGAGNGLGRAIALRLAAEFARVILVGRRAGTLDAVVGEIADATGRADRARAVTCDTASPASVDALVAELAGEDVSVLVNNAGVGGPVADLVDIPPEAWDEVFAVNVRGVYLMCRAFLPAMVRRRGGDIINVASVTGKRPLAGRTPYAASKMAVIGLTATLAHEVGRHGVNVNTLSPGPVEGDRMRRNFALDARRTGRPAQGSEAEFVSRAALRRLLTEEEVAAAVVAMLTMPGLTGADIDLSAGMVAR